MYDAYHQQAAAAAAAAQASNSRSNLTHNNSEAADAADSVPAATTATTGGAANTTLHRQQLQFAQDFWEEQIVAAEQYDSDFKNHPLPLARIKKVMKSDPEVKVHKALLSVGIRKIMHPQYAFSCRILLSGFI
jgi:ornithine carbamoyltransferase